MGTGEVARYLGTYGSERVSRAVLMGVVPPFLLQTEDNPNGTPASGIQETVEAIRTDRLKYLTDFYDAFYNLDELLGTRVSEEVVRDSWSVAAGASAIGTILCPPTWIDDFRDDVAKFDVPTLVIHGTADRILDIDATARRLPALIADCQLVEIEGAPHGLLWTHGAEVNEALLAFLGSRARATAAA